MKSGLKATRDVLGKIPGLTDAEIEESLYYYYFDVEKTINYLLSMITVCFLILTIYEDLCFRVLTSRR